MTKVAVAILAIVITAAACGAAYPAVNTMLERRATAKIAGRQIPSTAQLVGRTYYAVPPNGNGYSIWVFSIPPQAWQREFAKCPKVRRLTGSDLDSYHLHSLFTADQSVCFDVPEETDDTVRAWFASEPLLIVFTRIG